MNIKDRRAALRTTLSQRLQSATSPWEQLPILIELAKEPDPRNPQASHHYAEQGLTIARELNDPFWIAQGLRATGVCLTRAGRFSEALLSLREAAKIFEEKGELRLKAQTTLAIADTCIAAGELEEALQLIQACRSFFEEINDRTSLAFTFRSLGDFYKTVGEHSNVISSYRQAIRMANQAGLQQELGELYLRIAEGYRYMGNKVVEQRYLFKSLAVSRSTHNVRGLAWTISALATFYISIEQCKRAERYVRLTIRFSRAMGNIDYEGLAWGMLGTVYIDKKEYRKALSFFKKGLRIARQSENPLFRGLLYERMGSLYVEMKEYDRGISCLRKGLTMIEKSGQAFYVFQTHEKLAQAYEAAGNAAAALHHFKEFARTKDDHISSQKLLEISRKAMQEKLRKITDQLEQKRSQNRTLAQWVEQKEAELVALTRQLLNRTQDVERETARTAERQEMMLPENWEIFAHQFHKVHHGFYPQLVGRYPDLTPAEIKVCSLIRIGLSSKEIAEILCVSKRTVDNHRSRVHKKMALPQGASLTGFIAQI